MKYLNIYDMHTHSDNSFDGNHSCILLCEGACANGGKGIAITDHCDIDGKDYDFRAFSTNQFVESTLAKTAFKNKLDVLRGLELGQGIYKKEKSLQIIDKFQYDFILGAIHNLENTEDFYFMDYKNKDVDKLLTMYFEDILELAKWNKTDSIAHLTYPLRYITGRDGIKVDISKFYDIIDSIFETIIKNDKALEINVSGLFGELGDTLPNKELIKRYRDMGGKYITVGSDSHYYDKVCIGIDKGYDILLECGFKQFTIFKNREPVLLDIE
ncbi:MAG: histidinol-phosphatase HisJ family protein [Ruminococcaceae bacterium]|nr:histidinol-phosphatase HisJ family protein [Oscillospiraceae bacterium]